MLTPSRSGSRRPEEQAKRLELRLGSDVLHVCSLACEVLADSYGQNGLIDVVNLRFILTGCGEELHEDEFDAKLTDSIYDISPIFQQNDQTFFVPGN